MNVVARKQNEFAFANVESGAIANAQLHVPCGDKMRGNDMSRSRQVRHYAYLFGLVERFISAKMLDQGRAHVFDDQLALEALVRFSNDEIKHQELFRRIETMMAGQLPTGYRQVADPSEVARAVLASQMSRIQRALAPIISH
jgi:hypothetical protein